MPTSLRRLKNTLAIQRWCSHREKALLSCVACDFIPCPCEPVRRASMSDAELAALLQQPCPVALLDTIVQRFHHSPEPQVRWCASSHAERTHVQEFARALTPPSRSAGKRTSCSRRFASTATRGRASTASSRRAPPWRRSSMRCRSSKRSSSTGGAASRPSRARASSRTWSRRSSPCVAACVRLRQWEDVSYLWRSPLLLALPPAL